MQPDPSQHDVPRDPILDGRDSLRLVKLRLGLTLIAVAILPIAAVSPLVRAVAEEARVAHHERLVDQAADRRAELQREIADVLREQTQALLDDPAILAAAARGRLCRRSAGRLGTPREVRRAPGQHVLAAVAHHRQGRPGRARSGRRSSSAAAGRPRRRPRVAPGRPRADPRRRHLGWRRWPAGPSSPRLRCRRSSPPPRPRRRCRGASSASPTPAGWSRRVDRPVRPERPARRGPRPRHHGRSRLRRPRRRSTCPASRAGRSCRSAPIPLVAMPVQALAALGAMLVLLVAFTIWMARQILRPARRRSRPPGRASTSCTRAPARRPSATASPGSATTAPSRRPSPGWSRARGATARRSRSCSSTSTSSSGSTTRRATRPATSCSPRSAR